MAKVFMTLVFILNSLVLQSLAGPIEAEKSSKEDLSTSETFGYGYYQPAVYSTPLVATGVPLATTAAISAPLTASNKLGSTAGGYARSSYGYGGGYKYGSGYDYGRRWGYGGGNAVNEFYRHHPVYVAWG